MIPFTPSSLTDYLEVVERASVHWSFEIGKKIDDWGNRNFDVEKFFASIGKFIVEQGLSRAFTFSFGVVKVLTALIDTINGARTAIHVILGCGLNRSLYKGTSLQLRSFQLLLPRLFRTLIELGDPNAFEEKIKDDSFYTKLNKLKEEKEFFQIYTKQDIKKEQDKDYAFFVHLNLIKFCAVRGLVRVGKRIYDIFVGMFRPNFNELGDFDNKKTTKAFFNIYYSLQIGGIPRDLFRVVSKILNPWINQNLPQNNGGGNPPAPVNNP